MVTVEQGMDKITLKNIFKNKIDKNDEKNPSVGSDT